MFVRLYVATAVHPTGTVKQLDIYTIRYFISIQDPATIVDAKNYLRISFGLI